MPPVSSVLPLSAALRAQGIQRFGFHGLSCASIVHQMAQAPAVGVPCRLLIAHLGNGASVTAVRDGVSIDRYQHGPYTQRRPDHGYAQP